MEIIQQCAVARVCSLARLVAWPLRLPEVRYVCWCRCGTPHFCVIMCNNVSHFFTLSLSLPPSYNKISYHMHVRAAVLTVNIVIESVVAEALMLCGQARLCNKYNCHYIALAFNRMNARATCTPPQMMYDQLLWAGILELHGVHCYDPVRVSTHQCRALYCRSAWTIRRLVAEIPDVRMSGALEQICWHKHWHTRAFRQNLATI